MGSSLDLIIIGVYLCILVSVGIVFGRLVNTGSDYFRAGARGSWWLVGSSIFMSGISAYTFVGNAAGIYLSGWSPIAIYLANVAGFVVCAVFLAGWYRQMRVVTFAEILKERFGKVSEQIIAYMMVFNGYIWSGVVLYALAVFTQVIIPDIPLPAVIISVGTIVVLYCAIGGNWAVMANDFVQGLVLISVTIAVTILCLVKAGGIGGFFSAIAQSDSASQLQFITPVPEGQTMWQAKYTLTWVIVAFVIQFANQISLFQGVRFFSVKDGREAKKASVFAAVLMTMGLALFFIPSIYARLFLEDQVAMMHESPAKAVEYAYAVTSYALLPKGTFSIMLVAIFAAAISSLDTGFNRNAALIVRDLLPPLRRKLRLPEASACREVFLGKIATVVSGVIVMGIALIYSLVENVTIFDMMLLMGVLSLLLLIPMDSAASRWVILSVSGFVGGIGVLLIVCGKRIQNRSKGAL